MFILTQKYLQQHFKYEHQSGKLFKRFGKNKEVGSLMNGYRRVCIQRKSYLVHRIIWLYVYGYFPKERIDHIDMNRSNNRLENLRLVSPTENSINTRNRSNNTSGIIGVSFKSNCNKWQAMISINGKQTYLGLFKNFNSAVLTRYNAEKQFGYDKINNSSLAKQYVIKNKLI